MTVSRLIFKLLYPFCCPDTKIILGNMDAKAEAIQHCADDRIKQLVSGEHGWAGPRYGDNFGRWLDILEVGTFNPVERIAIRAALYDHEREATRKLICSTLVGGEVVDEFIKDDAERIQSEEKRTLAKILAGSHIGNPLE